jgi:hypothetical protein
MADRREQAPDIFVNGAPIGQAGDGVAYLRFLTLLKSKLPPTKSVSIAAPASYWYLKAFPIDRISAVIDYIVYMQVYWAHCALRAAEVADQSGFHV